MHAYESNLLKLGKNDDLHPRIHFLLTSTGLQWDMARHPIDHISIDFVFPANATVGLSIASFWHHLWIRFGYVPTTRTDPRELCPQFQGKVVRIECRWKDESLKYFANIEARESALFQWSGRSALKNLMSDRSAFSNRRAQKTCI